LRRVIRAGLPAIVVNTKFHSIDRQIERQGRQWRQRQSTLPATAESLFGKFLSLWNLL
jgi:hypothetical protein